MRKTGWMGVLLILVPAGALAVEVGLVTAVSGNVTLQEDTAPSKPSYGAPKVFPIPALHGDRAIVRQNSVTNAVKLITDSVHSTDEADWDELADMVIAIARKFEAYSCGDLDMEQAIAMAETKADE